MSIVDFQFNPGTTTIHVGDTITWTNGGPSPHSATANDHSFDTGILQKGQSASHTFTQSGTFTYFCTVHPFMHGTVVVLASSSSSSGSSGTTGTSGTTSGSSGASSGSSGAAASSGTSSGGSGSLPFTGDDLELTTFYAVLLIAAGAALRLWSGWRHRDHSTE